MKVYFPFLFVCLFLKIESNFYLTMKLDDVDDYIVRIYNKKNETLFECAELNGNDCNYYPDPLIQLNYEFGDTLFFYIYDIGGGAGFIRITVYINEYIITPEHQKFWTCTDCYGKNHNYIYILGSNRFDFYDYDKNPISYRYFNFYFQINSYSELNYERNTIDNEYYAFTEQNDFYILSNSEEEVDIINFNTTDIFYIKNDQSLETPFNFINFKINIINTFKGQLIGLDESNNDITLNDNDYFLVSKNKGLRYKTSDKEIIKKGVYLKLRIRAHNSPPEGRLPQPISLVKDFNFIYMFEWISF